MRKRLWQGAVIMDAYVAMFTGHSSCIAENEFDAKPASVEKVSVSHRVSQLMASYHVCRFAPLTAGGIRAMDAV